MNYTFQQLRKLAEHIERTLLQHLGIVQQIYVC